MECVSKDWCARCAQGSDRMMKETCRMCPIHKSVCSLKRSQSNTGEGHLCCRAVCILTHTCTHTHTDTRKPTPYCLLCWLMWAFTLLSLLSWPSLNHICIIKSPSAYMTSSHDFISNSNQHQHRKKRAWMAPLHWINLIQYRCSDSNQDFDSDTPDPPNPWKGGAGIRPWWKECDVLLGGLMRASIYNSATEWAAFRRADMHGMCAHISDIFSTHVCRVINEQSDEHICSAHICCIKNSFWKEKHEENNVGDVHRWDGWFSTMILKDFASFGYYKCH